MYFNNEKKSKGLKRTKATQYVLSRQITDDFHFLLCLVIRSSFFTICLFLSYRFSTHFYFWQCAGSLLNQLHPKCSTVRCQSFSS